MTQSDLNLLAALDVLLEEQSVTSAAERLHLSVPATSRTLSRIRQAFGDPILVRAGRGLVPTPYALASRVFATVAASVLIDGTAFIAALVDGSPAFRLVSNWIVRPSGLTYCAMAR